ncbi:MAG: redoxin domain-containing protein [Verrucomicrobia bacterium]|nr:redoxin domain-containing protein [Verrucomicrobiota bacterium]
MAPLVLRILRVLDSAGDLDSNEFTESLAKPMHSDGYRVAFQSEFDRGLRVRFDPSRQDQKTLQHREFPALSGAIEPALTDSSISRIILDMFLLRWIALGWVGGNLLLQAQPVLETRAPGHSYHGEAFNEGPRQRAYLMPGMPEIAFPITTRSPEAQKFFIQGVGQLHGFWYFEAERSFREASLLDTNAPMPFWGMAMANANNAQRARGFLTNAMTLKATASSREQRLIEALSEFHTEEKEGKKRDLKQRRRHLIRAYEALVEDFPEDMEIRALLVYQIWDNSGFGNNTELSISSHLAVDELTKAILSKHPLHPVHHFRIHLWDPEKPSKALRSAALCGAGSPGIAHMWHMPGHTYAKLARHDDAAWQQEASARTDHAYMIRDRVMPDQIHNYTHNNDWLVESWSFSGRVKEAIALAKNLSELPRLMRTNSTLATQPSAPRYDYGRSSWKQGRSRLLSLLPKFELWDELITLAGTPHLDLTSLPDEQARLAVALGAAHFAKGQVRQAGEQTEALDRAQATIRSERQAAVDHAETTARREKKSADQIQKAMTEALGSFNSRMEKIESFRAELRALAALADKDTNELTKQLELAKDIPKIRLARIHAEAGDLAKAESLAKEASESATNQVLETAIYAHVLRQAGKTNEAAEAARKLASMNASIDLDLPAIKRLDPLLKSIKLDLSRPAARRGDFGERPDLANLGPLHWTPPAAPSWTLTDGHGRRRDSSQYRGRPYVMLFYLGKGCAHCMEQLNKFEEAAKDFEKAGLALVAVSTDAADALKQTSSKQSSRFSFPLLADPTREAFRAFHAFDGFEQTPLHGTFLIDGEGLLRWQDIGFEPFLETAFLLDESKRLLRFGNGSKTVAAAKTKASPRGPLNRQR